MNPKYLVNTGAYGFLDEVYEVRILLCYLLKHSPKPLTHDQISEITSKNDLINYFYLENALSGLVELGYAKINDAKDGKNYYTLTEKGEEIEREFKGCIPPALRDRIVEEAVNVFAKIRREKEYKCEIKQVENGYIVSFVLQSADIDIADINLFAPDVSTAKYFEKRIKNNPSEFYKHILNYLTEGYDKVKLNESPIDNL